MARSAGISPTTITSCVTVRSSILLSGRCLCIRAGHAQTGGLFLIYDVVSVTVASQGDVVDLAGALHGDEAVFDVAGDQVRLALEGIPITSSARKAQDDPLLGIHALLAFGVKLPAVSGAHRPRGPGRSTLAALGRATGAVVHGGEDPGGVAANPDLHLLAEAAPVSARPLGVGAELAFVHDDGGDALYHLGRNAADAAGEGRRRESVTRRTRAHAPAGEEHVGEGLAALSLAGDLSVPQAVGALGQDFIGDNLCKGAVDHAR